jgi:hypothetical protein
VIVVDRATGPSLRRTLVFQAECGCSRSSSASLETWSCAIWSLADYSTPEGRMRGWDPNGCCLRHSLFPEDRTLAERLTGWLDGNNEDSPQPSAQAPSPTC